MGFSGGGWENLPPQAALFHSQGARPQVHGLREMLHCALSLEKKDTDQASSQAITTQSLAL